MMTRSVILIATVVILAACTSSAPHPRLVPIGHQPEEETAILEAMDRYMTAISNSDLPAMMAMQTSEGMTYQGYATEGGGMDIKARANSHWTDPSRLDERDFRERYWSPTVLIRGGMAVVWAPYEFWIDGETSHCGIDIISFIKIDGNWLVANAMWTIESNAYAELRPADATELRPQDDHVR